MKQFRSFALFSIVFAVADAPAYETPVHKLITRHALERSRFGISEKLGVNPNTIVQGLALRVWMENGAVEEDDGSRALNHFFNPVDLAPLTIGKWPLCESGPGNRADWWATSDVLNFFSVADAKNHYRLALIGGEPEYREAHLKELFLALGHIVHLVQDMGQPEHARNDIHLTLGKYLDRIIAFVVRERMPSLYEAWALNYAETRVDFDGYPTVRLPDYESYFHTADRRGMADFSNAHFLTQDTNYGDYSGVQQPCFRFDYPNEAFTSRRLDLVTERVRTPDGTCCISVEVFEDVLTSHTFDSYTQSPDVDPYHSFYSALDLETLKYDVNARFYSLGDGSYFARASMLIPRAVGYSAGLIEHLFRGEIDAQWKRNTIGGYDLTITNKSTEALGADARIDAVYRASLSYFQSQFFDTGRIAHDAPISSMVPGFAGLQPGASVTFPVIPGDP